MPNFFLPDLHGDCSSYPFVMLFGLQMLKVIYTCTPCSSTQMQLPISGHLVVCSYHHLCLIITILIDHLRWYFSRIWSFSFFLFAAIAELLDNAVDEVIIPNVWTIELHDILNVILHVIFFCHLQHTKLLSMPRDSSLHVLFVNINVCCYYCFMPFPSFKPSIHIFIWFLFLFCFALLTFILRIDPKWGYLCHCR